MESSPASPLSSDDEIIAVAVAGFEHERGAEIEWLSASDSWKGKLSDPTISSLLAACALPDGAHRYENDWAAASINVEGVSVHILVAYAQAKAGSVITSGTVTRSYVQKSVLIVSRHALWSSLFPRVFQARAEYFGKGNLDDRSALEAMKSDLEAQCKDPLSLQSALISVRSRCGLLVRAMAAYPRRLLRLWKALWLHDVRVVVSSVRPSTASDFVIALSCSLPGHPGSLFGPSPEAQGLGAIDVLAGTHILPLAPLQQLDDVRASSRLLVGSSNALFVDQKVLAASALVRVFPENVSSTRQDWLQIEWRDKNHRSACSLTDFDQFWADSLQRRLREDFGVPGSLNNPKVIDEAASLWLVEQLRGYGLAAMTLVARRSTLASQWGELWTARMELGALGDQLRDLRDKEGELLLANSEVIVHPGEAHSPANRFRTWASAVVTRIEGELEQLKQNSSEEENMSPRGTTPAPLSASATLPTQDSSSPNASQSPSQTRKTHEKTKSTDFASWWSNLRGNLEPHSVEMKTKVGDAFDSLGKTFTMFGEAVAKKFESPSSPPRPAPIRSSNSNLTMNLPTTPDKSQDESESSPVESQTEEITPNMNMPQQAMQSESDSLSEPTPQ